MTMNDVNTKRGDYSDLITHFKNVFNADVGFIMFLESLEVSSLAGVALSCVLILISAVVYQGIKFLRKFLQSKESCHGEDRRILAGHHLIQTVLYILQVLGGYGLMLVVMTFNIWLFLATTAGLSIGYFVYGWCLIKEFPAKSKKTDIYSIGSNNHHRADETELHLLNENASSHKHLSSLLNDHDIQENT